MIKTKQTKENKKSINQTKKRQQKGGKSSSYQLHCFKTYWEKAKKTFEPKYFYC